MYRSRSLPSAETLYSFTDLETTAVAFGLKKCRFYCAGHKVIIIVDHKPLAGTFREAGKPIPDVLSPCILRFTWKLLRLIIKLYKGKGKACKY
jgi:hypothetical protein